LHFVEKALNDLVGVNVKHLRPAFFYGNLLSNIGLIKNMGIMGANYGENTTMVLVHPNDIAEVAAEELLELSFIGKSIRYISSQEVKSTEIDKLIGQAIGKPELQWVNFADEDSVAGMIQAGLPEEIAKNYAEMGAAMRSGEMASDYYNNRPASLGKTKFEDFVPVFKATYEQP
jgi:hypothetical protein